MICEWYVIIKTQWILRDEREGCEGHAVALPFDAEFTEAEKGLLKRSETRNKPDPKR